MPKNVEPDAGKNHGTDKTNGIRTDYGKDSSFMVGSKNAERGLSGFAGGKGDLGRTLSGGSVPNEGGK